MHLCLSCNQPCNISSIFCEACRLSLSEHPLEENQESLLELVHETTETGAGEPIPVPQEEAKENAPQTEAGGVLTFIQETGEDEVWIQDDPPGLFYDLAAPAMEPAGVLVGAMAVTRPPERRHMPKRVRVALLIFCIVGVLALTVDGVLLALSIMRHHSQALATSSSHVILPQVQSERKSATRTPVTASASPPIAPTFTSSPPDGSFALSSTHLNFSLSQGESNPAPQTVILSAGGHSAFSWLLVPSSSFPTWLSLSAAQGTTSAGADGRVVVNVQATRLTIGTYTAQFLVQAFNSKGHGLPGSPRTLDITLNVMIPCSLIVVPTKLSFESVLLSNPAPQSLSLREKGGCAFPITWQASSTANWVKFSHASLSDNGSGSALLVSVNISGKLVGSYTAQVTLQATDANGLPVPSSPLMITVTLTVVLN